MNVSSTPYSTLSLARNIALKNGVRYAYTGNVHDLEGESTYCHNCGDMLVGRNWHQLSTWNISEDGYCQKCGTAVAGFFDGPPGVWGAKRQRVTLKNDSS